jgi:carboxypeptidase PM20D1
VSDVNSPAYALLAQTIRDVMPDVVVVPFVMLAATDARHFADLSPNVFRFGPMRVSKSDLSRVHGTNERISVENVGEVVAFYTALIRNADAATERP